MSDEEKKIKDEELDDVSGGVRDETRQRGVGSEGVREHEFGRPGEGHGVENEGRLR